MATELFSANRASTTVASGGTGAPAPGTQETWTVASSAMFGTAASGSTQFHVADPAAPSEIIAVTSVSGTTWTVTRGAESTTPVAHAAGFAVYQVVTSGWLGSVGTQTASVSAMLAQAAPLIAHRGLPQVGPEETMTAFRSAVSVLLELGYVPALKIDAVKLADGTFGVMHDTTVDRTTTSSGNASGYTAQTWQTLLSPAGTLLGPAWASQSVPLLTDILDALGGKCVLIIEPKNGASSVPAVLSLITARRLQASCLLTAEDTTLTMPGLCAAAGVGFLYYWNTNSTATPVTPSQAAGTAGVTALGVGVANAANGAGFAYTDAQVTSVVSAGANAGIPVAGFTYVRRSDYSHAAGLGITVHQANDLYAAGSAPLGTTDQFAIGSPQPGEVGSNPPTVTGTTQAPSYQYAGGAGFYRRAVTNSPVQSGIYECLGFLGPAAGSGGGTYTVGGTVFWDSTETGSGPDTRFAGIAVGCPDDTAFNGNPIINGYNCLIRQGNGATFTSPTFQIFKQTRGAYQNNGTYASGTSTQAGTNFTNTTGYAAPNTLGQSYSAGAVATSIILGSTVTIPAGMRLALPNGQIATCTTAVTSNITVPTASLTVATALSSGAAVSFGIPFTVRVDSTAGTATTITFKRTDTNDQLAVTDSSSPYSGGYVHIGKTGTVAASTLAVSYAGVSA